MVITTDYRGGLTEIQVNGLVELITGNILRNRENARPLSVNVWT